jgi:hypothetical protein
LHDEKYHAPTPIEIDEIYASRERKGWDRYTSIPELKALIEEHGITSLAHFYTSKVKYDPDYFTEVSKDMRELLERKHFLP